MTAAWAMLVALGLDALLGWPQPLYARIGHPVTWIGNLIARADEVLNRPGDGARRKFWLGLASAVAIIAIVSAVAVLLAALMPGGIVGIVLTGILAWPLVAARSLYTHVHAVAQPLGEGRTDDARAAVAMIVGRDPSRLDEAGIARAGLESLAESASDGVVAPLFWGALLGLPGIAAYKAVNTLDSMIGYRTARHEAFGCAAARIDDAANFVPARLAGALFAAVSGRTGQALSVMWADAGRHRSPNAGWPESALAGALGVRLSGPRIYAGGTSEEPWLNGDAPDPAPQDMQRGLSLYCRAMAALAVLLAICALL